jgi:hypothetical protein
MSIGMSYVLSLKSHYGFRLSCTGFEVLRAVTKSVVLWVVKLCRLRNSCTFRRNISPSSSVEDCGYYIYFSNQLTERLIRDTNLTNRDQRHFVSEDLMGVTLILRFSWLTRGCSGTAQMNISPPFSASKGKPSKKVGEVGGKFVSAILP